MHAPISMGTCAYVYTPSSFHVYYSMCNLDNVLHACDADMHAIECMVEM